MAEILFLQRGNHRAVDDFERFIDGTLLPYFRTYHEKDAEGKQTDKEVKHFIQVGRREYKIVGLAVPDEYVDKMLNGLEVGDGDVHPIQAKVAVNLLRKAMGAQKIKKAKDRGTQQVVIPRPGVAIYPIGVRKDEVSTWTDKNTGESFTQENL